MQELIAEVSKRLGSGWNGQRLRHERVIHDNDVERLKQLLADYPALAFLARPPKMRGGVLSLATGAYGEVFDPEREKSFTRAACAELLIDAGAIVMPSV